ncbi:mechanosensitive ion channel [Candidatus Uhrbacteria bacterium]|nr:mechanosensitive ion channel [Candidatus Uhrbacteria bacterium]
MIDPSMFFERFFSILAIFFVAVFLYWLLELLVKKLSAMMRTVVHAAEGDDQRVATIGTLIRTIGSITLFFIAGSMILRTLQIDITPILTGAGILGVIASFSAQTLVRDVIAGLFILLEHQYAPGMVVQLDSVRGMVERISLRSTVIRDTDGHTVFVPNGEIHIIRVIADAKKKPT